MSRRPDRCTSASRSCGCQNSVRAPRNSRFAGRTQFWHHRVPRGSPAKTDGSEGEGGMDSTVTLVRTSSMRSSDGRTVVENTCVTLAPVCIDRAPEWEEGGSSFDADDWRPLGRRASRLTSRLRARRLPHREEVGTATPCSQGDTRATSFVAALAAERSRGPRCGALESSRTRSERRRT